MCAYRTIYIIFFEAEMGALHRNSLKINELSALSSSAASTLAPYSTEFSTPPDHSLSPVSECFSNTVVSWTWANVTKLSFYVCSYF
jgi:hypothetical protein